jgi:hypothetical protein
MVLYLSSEPILFLIRSAKALALSVLRLYWGSFLFYYSALSLLQNGNEVHSAAVMRMAWQPFSFFILLLMFVWRSALRR